MEPKTYISRVGCVGTVSQSKTSAAISAFEDALADVRYSVEIGLGIEAAKQVFR